MKKLTQNIFSAIQNINEVKLNKSACEISIVDDDPFCCMMTEERIKDLGYTNIKTFLCGEDYLDHIKVPSKNQRIVFLDHEMTGMSGFELLKEIRTRNLKIMVIMVSGQEDMNIAIQSFQVGVFCYINKSDCIEEKIKQVLNRIHETLLLEKKQAQSNWKKLFQLLSVETLLFFQPSSFSFFITLFTTVTISVLTPVVMEKLNIVFPWKQFVPYIAFIVSSISMMVL